MSRRSPVLAVSDGTVRTIADFKALLLDRMPLKSTPSSASMFVRLENVHIRADRPFTCAAWGRRENRILTMNVYDERDDELPSAKGPDEALFIPREWQPVLQAKTRNPLALTLSVQVRTVAEGRPMYACTVRTCDYGESILVNEAWAPEIP
jgi:hypothetical protein